MRVFRCLFFLLFPFFIFKILHIKMKRVGFSLVLCRYIDMDVEATIGHFNLIIVDSLVMKKESRIGHLNFIKGGFDVLMDEKSSIHNLNKISSIAVLYESVCLHLRREC